MLDRDADFRRLGIGEAGIESAIAFDNQADDRARAGSSSPASIRIAFTAESNSA